MESLRPPHFHRDPSKPVHDPLLGDDADPTQAATSLQSAPSILSEVSASAISLDTGAVYLLRGANPNLVILDSTGKIATQISDPDIVTGHSIKLIDIGKGVQPWVVDMGSSTIRIYDKKGTFQTSFGPIIAGSSALKAQGEVGIPEEGQQVILGKITDIAFDAKYGQFYITDGDAGGSYNRVVVLNTTYTCVAVWDATSPAINTIQLNVPHAVAVDTWSRLWIVDSHNSQIQLNVPHAVAVDTWSRLWIVDSHNSRVQVTNNTGTVLGAWFLS